MNDLLIVAAIGWALICGLWLGMWTAASGDPWRDRDERRHCLRMAWLTPVWPLVGAFLLTEDGRRIPFIRPAATTRGA